MKEQWIIDAENKIKEEVDSEIENLEQLAQEESLDVVWVLEIFLNKLQYKVKKQYENR